MLCNEPTLDTVRPRSSLQTSKLIFLYVTLTAVSGVLECHVDCDVIVVRELKVMQTIAVMDVVSDDVDRGLAVITTVGVSARPCVWACTEKRTVLA